MTVIFYAKVEAPSSTSNTAWTEHASKQGTLNAQKHWLWIYAEYGGTQTNRGVAIRVTVNGVEVAFDYHQPEIANAYKAFMTMIEIEPPTDDSVYTVVLDYRIEAPPQTALIRRVRLMVRQE